MVYDDVRKAIYRRKTKESRKALLPTLSVQLWIEQIVEKGGQGMFVDSVVGDNDLYVFAWCTKFQLKVNDCQIHLKRRQTKQTLFLIFFFFAIEIRSWATTAT
jgi:hypothetical protein